MRWLIFVLFPFFCLSQNRETLDSAKVEKLEEIHLYSSTQVKEIGFHNLRKTFLPALWSGTNLNFRGVYIENQDPHKKSYITQLVVNGLKIGDEHKKTKIQVRLYAFDPISKKLGEVLFDKTVNLLDNADNLVISVDQLLEFPKKGVIFALKTVEGKVFLRLGKSKSKIPGYIITSSHENPMELYFSDIFKPEKNMETEGFLPLLGLGLREY